MSKPCDYCGYEDCFVPSTADATEFAWLIEDDVQTHGIYWAGGISWTTEHNDAIHFVREVDALKVACHLPRTRVREHGLCK